MRRVRALGAVLVWPGHAIPSVRRFVRAGDSARTPAALAGRSDVPVRWPLRKSVELPREPECAKFHRGPIAAGEGLLAPDVRSALLAAVPLRRADCECPSGRGFRAGDWVLDFDLHPEVLLRISLQIKHPRGESPSFRPPCPGGLR